MRGHEAARHAPLPRRPVDIGILAAPIDRPAAAADIGRPCDIDGTSSTNGSIKAFTAASMSGEPHDITS